MIDKNHNFKQLLAQLARTKIGTALLWFFGLMTFGYLIQVILTAYVYYRFDSAPNLTYSRIQDGHELIYKTAEVIIWFILFTFWLIYRKRARNGKLKANYKFSHKPKNGKEKGTQWAIQMGLWNANESELYYGPHKKNKFSAYVSPTDLGYTMNLTLLPANLTTLEFLDKARKFAKKIGAKDVKSFCNQNKMIYCVEFIIATSLDKPWEPKSAYEIQMDAKKIAIECLIDTTGNSQFLSLNKVPGILMSGAKRSGKTNSIKTLLTPLVESEILKANIKVNIINGKPTGEYDLFKDYAQVIEYNRHNLDQIYQFLKQVKFNLDFRLKNMQEIRGENSFWENSEVNPINYKMPLEVLVFDNSQVFFSKTPKTSKKQTYFKKTQALITGLLDKGASAGICILVSTKHPETIAKEIRKNIPKKLAFRLPSKISEHYALDEKSNLSTKIAKENPGEAILGKPGQRKYVRFAKLGDDQIKVALHHAADFVNKQNSA